MSFFKAQLCLRAVDAQTGTKPSHELVVPSSCTYSPPVGVTHSLHPFKTTKLRAPARIVLLYQPFLHP